jgi:hypothetical protein
MWQEQLLLSLTDTHNKKTAVLPSISLEHALKYKENHTDWGDVTNQQFLREFGRTVKQITGNRWEHELSPTKDIRADMLEVLYKRAANKKNGITGVTLSIYRTMLYSVNDEMVYWKGVDSLSGDTLFDRKTVYKHLNILKRNRLIEFKSTGFHIHEGGWGKTTQIQLIE